MNNIKSIYFDMDGTIANLYGVKNWLDDVNNFNSRPFAIAEPLINMNVLAELLNILQKRGYTIGVISWLSKNGTEEYNKEVTKVKKEWLKKYLKTVIFDEINIVEYGTPKSTVCKNISGILFDDELRNRNEWRGTAYDVTNIIGVLKKLISME